MVENQIVNFKVGVAHECRLRMVDWVVAIRKTLFRRYNLVLYECTTEVRRLNLRNIRHNPIKRSTEVWST